MGTKLLAAAVLFAVWGSANAQAGRSSVYVEGSADDTQGQRLVYAVKEQIRRSAGMSLVDDEKASGFQVRLVTEDVDNGSIRTEYAIVITMMNLASPGSFPYYLDSTIGVCGSNVVDQCASTIAARIDRDASTIRAALKGSK